MKRNPFFDDHVIIIPVGYPGTDEPRLTGHPPADDIDDFTTMHLLGCPCPECQPDLRHDEAAA